MHFKDDPISDMHAKNYLIISCPKHFPGPTKFGPVFWSRLFRRGPVEYNYPTPLNTDNHTACRECSHDGQANCKNNKDGGRTSGLAKRSFSS